MNFLHKIVNQNCTICRGYEICHTKNCKGFDRIPQRVLADGLEVLKSPQTKIFLLQFTQEVRFLSKADFESNPCLTWERIKRLIRLCQSFRCQTVISTTNVGLLVINFYLRMPMWVTVSIYMLTL